MTPAVKGKILRGERWELIAHEKTQDKKGNGKRPTTREGEAVHFTPIGEKRKSGQSAAQFPAVV